MSYNTACGVFYYCTSTKRFLYLFRNDDKNYVWSIPGGKINGDETLLEGLKRECLEETSYWPTNAKLIPIQKFVNGNFTYHTFFCAVNEEFKPLLNEEHSGYAWVGDGQYPRPLHPGLFSTVNIDVVQEKLNLLIEKN
jgi:ADP-ribose pyrophosphatase YjhB (NUDIX family)